jgi:apolipoprotein N-acyltransferase
MQTLSPREASEPAEGPGEDALPGLRLTSRIRRSLPASLLLAVTSGVLLSFSQPPVGFGPVAFVALIPFLWLLRGARPRRALLLGFVFGMAYFGTLLYWIVELSFLGWFALSFASSMYVGLFALVAAPLWRDDHPVSSSIGLAALWGLTEYLRSMWPLGGFTWGGLGYSQVGNGFILPLASITGVWGVSSVVLLVNAFLLLALERVRMRPRLAAALVVVSLAAVLLPSLTPLPAPNGPPVDVAIVQGNHFDQRLPTTVSIPAIAKESARLHDTLASNPPDLVVWPEDAVDLDPRVYGDYGSLVSRAVAKVGVPTLVGTIGGLQDGRHRTYNESLLYDGQGRVVDSYVKRHLVPFGEYVPWRHALSFLHELQQVGSDFTPGTRGNVLHIDGLTFANVICFENSFPSLDRRMIDAGGGFLVVSTNNASFGRTAASRQHLAMSQMRAVENGRWVVHAAVSGISAFIDPHGHVIQPTQLYRATLDRATIRSSTEKTIYTRFGDWFPWAALLLVLILLLWPRRGRAESEAQLPEDARTLVVLPTYNEAATIQEVVDRTLAAVPSANLLVVDDGSPDGTAEIVRRIASEDARVRLLERPGKGGLAGAYRDGFRQALEDGYDLAVEMDSDLSHQPEQLPALLAAARRYDLTIGSRYIPGGGVSNWGYLRRLLSRAGNLYTQAALGIPVRDATSGFRVYRTGPLRMLLDRGLHADGYAFQIELAYQAWRSGLAVGEVPITFREREHGQSKISRRIVVEAIWLVTVWGVRDLPHRYPMRARAGSTAHRSVGQGRLETSP